MQLQGKRVTVVGLGTSGLASVRLLARLGAQVTVNDAGSREALGDKARAAEELGASLDLGGHDPERLANNDLIVVSPGVPSLAALDHAEVRGVKVVSEIELASWFVKSTVIGVTGTNGKSTVTTLLGEMCKATGMPTFVGGNLGTPLVDVVDSAAAEQGGYVVVELSSFQLERIERFRAHVGVLLNVTDDHLDRYPSFAAYAAAKGRLFATQLRADFAVAPAGDALSRDAGARLSRHTGAVRWRAGQRASCGRCAGRHRERSLHPRRADRHQGRSQHRQRVRRQRWRLAWLGVESAHIEQVLRSFRGPRSSDAVRRRDWPGRLL